MTRQRAAEITRDRVLQWAGTLRPHAATPVILLAVGHGKDLGKVHIMAVEDIPDEQVCEFLEFALRTLRAGQAEHAPKGT